MLHLGVNGCDVVRHQTGKVTSAIVEGVSIIGRFSRAQRVSILPVEISCNSSGVQRCLLPWCLNATVIGSSTVLFKETWLASCCTGGSVGCDPSIAPIVSGSPLCEYISSGPRVMGKGYTYSLWGRDGM